ncbi:hypothetical protein JOC93_001043 [Priestia taiwanensis]|uniref:Uncharacterized protein n=1 Tax=Priestia taiwanensis TaxID=1347902 RepID=A0A917EN75_9BACI|nr:hypothetical protein [Priestia taiwanensis]GGE62078.1 hypothetical protein GCM10007140_10430 [Priestia taiwanensis]
MVIGELMFMYGATASTVAIIKMFEGPKFKLPKSFLKSFLTVLVHSSVIYVLYDLLKGLL